jgi:hypothetical protein
MIRCLNRRSSERHCDTEEPECDYSENNQESVSLALRDGQRFRCIENSVIRATERLGSFVCRHDKTSFPSPRLTRCGVVGQVGGLSDWTMVQSQAVMTLMFFLRVRSYSACNVGEKLRGCELAETLPRGRDHLLRLARRGSEMVSAARRALANASAHRLILSSRSDVVGAAGIASSGCCFLDPIEPFASCLKRAGYNSAAPAGGIVTSAGA